MTTLNRNKPRAIQTDNSNGLPVGAAVQIFEGAAVGVQASTGYCRALVSGDKFAGFAVSRVDNRAGAAAAATVRLITRGEVELAVTGAVATSLGGSVYATDDDTFTVTPGGSLVGYVKRVPSAGFAVVAFDVLAPALDASQAEAVAGSVSRTPLNTQGGLLDASSWTRHARQFSYTDTDFTGIFWASVIRAADVIASPLAAYYCYVSSDHDASAGGIGLFTGPTPVGPWTWYDTVWTDTAATSSQTETPAVIWDEAGQRLLMFYQQLSAQYGASDASSAIGQQSTLMATSTDGLTWTKAPNFINDVAALTDQHGDGHTGYFWPFMSPKGWMAYSLYGGTTEYDYVQWFPVKGVIANSWRTNGVTMGYGLHMTQGSPLDGRDCMVMGVVRSGGTDYAIVRCFDGEATGADPQNGLVCIATISDDYRQITSRPTPVWTPSGSESTDLRSVTWAVFDGRLYIYFGLAKQTMECISHVL